MVLLVCVLGIRIYLKNTNHSPDADLGQARKYISRYDIEVIFNPDEKTLSACQKITVKNNCERELDELYFHIYPNAYKTKESAPFPKSEMEPAYPNGFSSGRINIKKIISEDVETQYDVDDTILKVRMSKPMIPGQQVNIEIQFDDILPNCLGRYGYGETTINLANWYPILCVYDENGWNTDPYYEVGDPFYSDIAQYEVSIKIPGKYIIAATGTLVDKVENNGWVTWRFKAGPVRDFALVASKQFNLAEEMVGSTRITSFFHKNDEESGKQALAYASKAISFFNDYFGEYPYDNFAVVSCDFFIGGMEYPNLVMIGRQFYSLGQILEYIVVHETAHQWWYGIVGNNQIKEAWLDEALTEYSTVLYYENVYDKKTGERVYNDFILNPYQFYEISRSPGPILRHLSQFKDWIEYDAVVYLRGAIMLKDLEYRMGKVKLRDALSYYFKANAFKNATTKERLKELEESMKRICGGER
jgi:hypothetical protein